VNANTKTTLYFSNQATSREGLIVLVRSVDYVFGELNMKHFSNRGESKPSASKGHDALSTSPNTITLRASSSAVEQKSLPSANRRIRNRSISDGINSNALQYTTLSPVDPTILSVLDEEEITKCSNSVDLLERTSPGTPPKKLWERQYGLFLRHRNRSVDNLSSAVEPIQTQSILQQAASKSLIPPTSPNTQDSAVRGGKFFASVFRSSNSDSTLSLKTRKNSSTDELDGTLRRGSDKAYYSPRNEHHKNSNANHSQANSPTGRAAYLPNALSKSSLRRSNSSAGRSSDSILLLPKVAARTDFNEENSLDYVAKLGETEAVFPPGPPLLFPPKEMMMRSNQLKEVSASIRTTEIKDYTPHRFESKMVPVAKNPSNYPNSIPEEISSSSEMKKAFTKIRHSMGEDANSAYLGDDPSLSHQNVFFAQKNERLGTQSSTNLTEMYSGPLDPVQEMVIVKSTRCLKPITGVEAWESGRRYLVAPAALAACPVAAINFLFGSSCATTKFAYNDAISSSTNSNSIFGMIILGECLLSYANDSAKSYTTKQWTLAQLVLRQNYLLEYDVGANVHTGVPRGFAHLEYAKTVLHEHFIDALELRFYGSPCAKADARSLIIRIRQSNAQSIDDSVHLHPEIRVAWQSCLNRAAELLRISDLYDYDEFNILGKGRYSEVRSARRRSELWSEKLATDLNEGGTVATSHVYDCAIKIFNKDKFWRMVVKGRERADTIVRETSVQAALSSRCSSNAPFLRICGFFETSKQVVLELELLEGTDLFKYVSSRTVLEEREAAIIARDILQCLNDMTKNGLAHRDVKPANILMCGENRNQKYIKGDLNGEDMLVEPARVKVGDFGMATFVGVDGKVRGRCGTPGYVAPEIFNAGIYGGYGNKVDVFSAGVTLYVMLCGYEPFYGETDEQLKVANKAAVVEFPKEDWSGVSAEAIDLVKRMMHPDPTKRLDARQALQHPWISKHLPGLQIDQTVTESITYRRDDACVVS
jgi:serine/threonine protein kinase